MISLQTYNRLHLLFKMFYPIRIHINFLVSIVLLGLVISAKDQSAKWSCIESKCVKLYTNLNINSTNSFYETQNICRLSCGMYGSLWPHPTGETVLSNERLYFDPRKVRFNLVLRTNTVAQYLTEMNRIFLKNIVKECSHNCTLPEGMEVLVKITPTSSTIQLNWDTDESYNITTRNIGSVFLIDIKAETIFGVRHALESLSQLITGNIRNGLVMVASARINDKPVYKHRGLLLDTARNFIPLRNIKLTLDAMALSKLNVFHWHATDSHSFPLEITRVPELQRYGAYSPKHVYSKKDVQNIVKYAKIRGIQVIIEIDGPSHAGNGWQWGPLAGLGDLVVCANKQPWRKFCIQPPCGQFNPVNTNLYFLLQKVFEELNDISPEMTIHMGGDEVFIDCWNSTEEITNHLHKMGLNLSTESFMMLWARFHEINYQNWQRVRANSTGNFSRQPVIVWSSHLTDPHVIEKHLPKESYIIQTWVESSLPLIGDLLRKGYRIISSTKDAWYLDHGFWGKTEYYNWQRVYQNKLPRTPGILGGEVCMWSEYVDEYSLDSKIWPRAGAAAERLWADPKTDANLAQGRFNRYRQRLISRGLKPSAIIPKWCTLNEGQCN